MVLFATLAGWIRVGREDVGDFPRNFDLRLRWREGAKVVAFFILMAFFILSKRVFQKLRL